VPVRYCLYELGYSDQRLIIRMLGFIDRCGCVVRHSVPYLGTGALQYGFSVWFLRALLRTADPRPPPTGICSLMGCSGAFFLTETMRLADSRNIVRVGGGGAPAGCSTTILFSFLLGGCAFLWPSRKYSDML
jgi:hypothetical protein